MLWIQFWQGMRSKCYCKDNTLTFLKCAGPVVAQERDGGCGFGDAQPNDRAAKALQGRALGRQGPALM